MKIGLVTPYDYPYPGGVTEHVSHLDREFRRLGHETRIIAPSSQSQAALEPHVIKVGGEVTPLQANGAIARLALSPLVIQQVKTILDREAFDVVHVHEPAVPLLSVAVLLHSQAVTVGTFHALLKPNTPAEAVYPFAMWPVMERLDGRIFVSPPLRDAVAGFFPGEHRVIPNGVEYAAFASPAIRPIEAFNDGRPNILFVGRMEERKGFRHLMRAYPYVKQAVPDARLLVVGAYNADETAAFARYARRYHLDDVHFIGRVSHEELPRYYRTATVFCVPSTGSESFGIVLLEGMAAGIPVIASDIAGYRSVLTSGQEGTLVEPGNERALAEAITGLLHDPARRSQLAARGRATAQGYDWSRVAPRVLDYYAELIEARAAQPVPVEGDAWKRFVPQVASGTPLRIPGVDLNVRWDVGFEEGVLRVRGGAGLAIGGTRLFQVALG